MSFIGDQPAQNQCVKFPSVRENQLGHQAENPLEGSNGTSLALEKLGCNPECRVCHYKHLDYDSQLTFKRRWALKNLARWQGVLRDLIPAPEEDRLGYRSKTWLRAHYQSEEAVGTSSGTLLDYSVMTPRDLSFGMFRSLQREGKWEKEFVSWNTCPIPIPPIQEMVSRIRSTLQSLTPRQIFATHFPDRLLTQEISEFVLQSLVGVWMGYPHLVIISREAHQEVFQRIDWSKILVHPFNRVWFHQNAQVGRKIFGHRPIELIFGPPASDDHPIRAFRQMARGLLVQAREQAVSALLKSNPTFILDLYCGTGDLSHLLPPEVGWLGIEHSKDAVQFANSLRSGKESMHQAYTGGVEQRLADPRVLSRISGSYSLYLNPPRQGLTADASARLLEVIQKNPPNRIAYLSCSASSLARDLEWIEAAGYSVETLQPYDFFPQTEHFEILANLTRR